VFSAIFLARRNMRGRRGRTLLTLLGIVLGVAQTIGAQLNPAWFQLAGHLVTLALLAFRPTGLFARTRDSG